MRAIRSASWRARPRAASRDWRGFRQRLRIESGTSFFQVGQRVGHGDFGGGDGPTHGVKLGGTRFQLAGHDLVLEELGMRVGVRLKGGARFG